MLGAALSLGVSAQTIINAQVSGTFGKQFVEDGVVHGNFDCTGTPTCTGQFSVSYRESGCINTFALSEAITITGLNLAQSGGIQGTLTLAKADFDLDHRADGTCAIRPGPVGDAVFPYSGTWNVSTGAGTFTFTINSEPGDNDVPGTFTATVTAPTPVFPMTVTSNITSQTATAAADIQFRPQDVGTTASGTPSPWHPGRR